MTGNKVKSFDGLKLSAAVDKIAMAKLQPYQRVVLLRDYLVSKYLHGLTFGEVCTTKYRVIFPQLLLKSVYVIHYCHEKIVRKYLQNNLNVKMWEIYSSDLENVPVTISLFRNIFNTRYNLSFDLPRKDFCSICLSLTK